MKGALSCFASFAAALTVAAVPASASETTTYTYDELGRLVGVVVSGTAPTSGQTVTTTFDPAGNRTNLTVGGANAATNAVVSAANSSVVEGGTLGFAVTRGGNTASAFSVNYATANGTAVSPGDYAAASGTLTFAANETSKTVNVGTVNDAAAEADETITLTLSAPTAGATLGSATATGTINDNRANLAISNATATEGGALSFIVTRSGLTSTSVSASYASANDSAISGNDYNAATGTVSFAANQTTASINITTIDDVVFEQPETMTVNLTAPSVGATITTAAGTGTINDNDPTPAQLAIGNASATEGGALSFTVTRSTTTSTAVSVSYSTSSGSATSGSDFVSASGTVNLAVNETTKTINIATIDDTATEPTESMTVTLSNPSANASITTASGTGAIADNDGMIILTSGYPYVLPAHQSTYACAAGGFEGSIWDTCWLTTNGVTVWDFFASPQLDPGYSFNAQGEFQVQTSHYGTGVAP